MTTEEKLDSLGNSITRYKAMYDRGNRMRKLQANPDFVELFEEDYFKEYAGALVVMRADPAMQTPDKQQDLLRNMDGIGFMQKYMQGVIGRGNQAGDQIKAYEDEREYLLKEESN